MDRAGPKPVKKNGISTEPKQHKILTLLPKLIFYPHTLFPSPLSIISLFFFIILITPDCAPISDHGHFIVSRSWHRQCSQDFEWIHSGGHQFFLHPINFRCDFSNSPLVLLNLYHNSLSHFSAILEILLWGSQFLICTPVEISNQLEWLLFQRNCYQKIKHYILDFDFFFNWKVW